MFGSMFAFDRVPIWVQMFANQQYLPNNLCVCVCACARARVRVCVCVRNTHHVRVNCPQTVAVWHSMGGATAAQRMGSQRCRAGPHQGRGRRKCRRGLCNQRPQVIGRGEGSHGARAGDGASDWTGEIGGGTGFERLDWRLPVHAPCRDWTEG